MLPILLCCMALFEPATNHFSRKAGLKWSNSFDLLLSLYMYCTCNNILVLSSVSLKFIIPLLNHVTVLHLIPLQIHSVKVYYETLFPWNIIEPISYISFTQIIVRIHVRLKFTSVPIVAFGVFNGVQPVNHFLTRTHLHLPDRRMNTIQ